MRFIFTLVLCLCLPSPSIGQVDGDIAPLGEQLDRPFVALFELSDSPQYSKKEIKRLRSHLKHERDQQLEDNREDQERYRKQLQTARNRMADLNRKASRDFPAVAAQREELHIEVAALEKVLRDTHNQEQNIHNAFEVKIAKSKVLERWPARRSDVIRRIESGRARERKHGDADDIGYRKLVNTDDNETAAGERAVREMAASGLMPPRVQDAGVQQYARDISGRIARASDLKTPLHVAVLDSPEINAVGLPGGFLFVTSGLMLAAENEAELAGVLSRQIASIAARHRARASKRSAIGKIIVPLAQVATGLLTGGVSSAGVYYGMNYGFQGLGVLVDRAFTERTGKYRKEADQLGIQYAWNAGFDPKGFIAFLDSMAKTAGRRENDSIQTPDLGDRLVDAFSEIQCLPAKAVYTDESSAFEQVQQRLKAIARPGYFVYSPGS